MISAESVDILVIVEVKRPTADDRLNDTVSRLEAEISALKGQVAGKGDLAKLIADAKNLLGDDNSINDKGLGRAA